MSSYLDEAEKKESISRKYYPHIDGLRALAIIGVLLYHFCPNLCPGGYTGVDVFFVISGYLITGGILKDLNSGKFSIKIFYIRRIKRIMPTYFAVILAVLISSAYFIPVHHLKSIFDASLWSLFDGANFYFYKFINYFALAAKNNPLLHLWSLGVEEQFYLIIPLILQFLYAKKRRILIIYLILIFALSLACSIITVSSKSFLHNSDYGFYMLPSRAWELLTGSLMAYFGLKYNILDIKKKWLEYLGLILIIIPYLVYNDKMPFPGLAAFPPILGAVLLIISNNNILAAKPITYLGKISYSVYLWHWPIYVFSVATEPTPIRVFFGLLISFLVSLLSWYFVENKIRNNQSISNDAIIGYFAIITVLILILILSLNYYFLNNIVLFNKNNSSTEIEKVNLVQTIIGKTADEWVEDNNPTKLDDLTTKSDVELIPIGSNQKKPRFIFWGDSHALALLPGLDLATKKYKYAGLYINKGHVFVGSRRQESIDSEKAVCEWLYKHKEITEVIIAQYWLTRLKSENDSIDFINLCRYLESIGKKIIIFSSCIETTETLNYLINSNQKFVANKYYISKSRYDSRAFYMYKLFTNLTNAKLANIISLQDAFYDGSAYRPFVLLNNRYKTFFYDDNHLNKLGSTYAAEFYGSILDDYLKNNFNTLYAYEKNLPNSKNIKPQNEETFEEIVNQATTGFSEEQYKLGILYRDGIDVKKDINEAAKWFLRSADQGNTQALTAFSSIETKISKVDLLNTIKELAEEGVNKEQYKLGILYRDGIDVKKDINEAAKWFLRSADQGNTQALTQMGIIYHYDKTLMNYPAAINYMLAAYQTGFGDAAYYLGLWYFRG